MAYLPPISFTGIEPQYPLEDFAVTYQRAIQNALNRPGLGVFGGGGMYRSTNPALAGRAVSGISGTPLYGSMEEQQAAQSRMTTPAPTAPVVPPVVPSPIVNAATEVAGASKPVVPQFVVPYAKPSGPGAYGESDVNPFYTNKKMF